MQQLHFGNGPFEVVRLHARLLQYYAIQKQQKGIHHFT